MARFGLSGLAESSLTITSVANRCLGAALRRYPSVHGPPFPAPQMLSLLSSAQCINFLGVAVQVIPYLVRRAQENSTVLAGIQKEKAMLLAELWRRLRQDSFPMRLLTRPAASQAT